MRRRFGKRFSPNICQRLGFHMLRQTKSLESRLTGSWHRGVGAPCHWKKLLPAMKDRSCWLLAFLKKLSGADWTWASTTFFHARIRGCTFPCRDGRSGRIGGLLLSKLLQACRWRVCKKTGAPANFSFTDHFTDVTLGDLNITWQWDRICTMRPFSAQGSFVRCRIGGKATCLW